MLLRTTALIPASASPAARLSSSSPAPPVPHDPRAAEPQFHKVYEFGGLHVPLVVAGPGISKGKSEALVYLMDLFPTFAEFAGAKLPAGAEGESIVPILTRKETKVANPKPAERTPPAPGGEPASKNRKAATE